MLDSFRRPEFIIVSATLRVTMSCVARRYWVAFNTKVEGAHEIAS